MHQNYIDCLEYLTNAGFEEVNGYDFYRVIFPNNQNSGDFQPPRQPNAIYLYRDDERAEAEFQERIITDKNAMKRDFYRRIMLNDTWESDYINYVEGNPMPLCSGLAYRGYQNRLDNARAAHAIIVDLDSVGGFEIGAFFKNSMIPRKFQGYPLPTYIVLSGSGLHVYYVFDEPVDLYPNIKQQMKALKNAMTNRFWIPGSTSTEEIRQYGCISQGFRMPGSYNQKYGTEVVAFRIGDRIRLEDLNKYFADTQVDIHKKYKEKSMTLEQALDKFPNWIPLLDDSKRGRWTVKRDLYEWFKRRIKDEGVVGGRRYWWMHMLAVYANKCGIDREELDCDLQWAFELLRDVEHVNELTEYDMNSARKAFYKTYAHRYTIEKIKRRTGVDIERKKRNGRTQAEHLRRARAVQEIDYPDGAWREGNGRPSALHIVSAFRKSNPAATKTQCIRVTELSKPTVYKWWDA